MLWATCTVKQCELLVPFTLSRTRSVPAAWRQTFCWLWRTSVLFSPKRTSFLHSVFMWMLTVCALRESVSMCGSGRVCVCLRVLKACSFCHVFTYWSHDLLGNTPCLVTSWWPCVIYYAFILLCQTLTKYRFVLASFHCALSRKCLI